MPLTNHPEPNILAIAAAEITAIPIIENHEPMIDLCTHPEIAYGPSPEIPNNTDYTKMRQSVYEKLKQAQQLLPSGVFLCLYESYRSLELQKSLFDTRFAKINQQQPNGSYKQLFLETIKMVSPIINLDGSPNIPPHATGGAVDVYLIDEHHRALEMGIHPKDWMSDLDGSRSLTASAMISPQARQNRTLLNEVMNAVGFVNYPNEYWHWSYGDRYWAYYKQQAHAIYDCCDRN